MKRIIGMLLAFMFMFTAFSISACGGGSSDSNAASNSSSNNSSSSSSNSNNSSSNSTNDNSTSSNETAAEEREIITIRAMSFGGAGSVNGIQNDEIAMLIKEKLGIILDVNFTAFSESGSTEE